MEPLSVTAAAIVTGFVSKGVEALAKQVGAAASQAARSLAEAVLDRLRRDPLEQRTVDRYERDPEAQQPAIEQAIADLIATDAAFAEQLQRLVADYESARTESAINIAGDATGPVVQGDKNIVVGTNPGTIRIDRDPG